MTPFDGSPWDYFPALLVVHGAIWTACVCVYFVGRVWRLLSAV